MAQDLSQAPNTLLGRTAGICGPLVEGEVAMTPIAFGSPTTQQMPPRCIDASLARGIRRGYFRRLRQEWQAYATRRHMAAARNLPVGSRIESQRQLDRRITLFDRLLGPLLNVYSEQVNANSRSGGLYLSIEPHEISAKVQEDSHASVRACMLLRPGRPLTIKMPLTLRAHAVDRVVQRSGLIDAPVCDPEIQAINAEFADMLPLASFASWMLLDMASGDDDVCLADLQVLMPAAHGVFLGGWDSEQSQLVIRTFVDYLKLNEAQREAVRELKSLHDGELGAQLLSEVSSGWLRLDQAPLRRRLVEAWRAYGYRFSEDRLHPGLSDRAWQERPSND